MPLLYFTIDSGIILNYFQDIISDIHEPCEYPKIEITETKLKGIPRNETHPLWKDTPAHTYGDRTWLPKNNRLKFASAITNSETVGNFKISESDKNAAVSSEGVEKRVVNLLKDVFVGGMNWNDNFLNSKYLFPKMPYRKYYQEISVFPTLAGIQWRTR